MWHEESQEAFLLRMGWKRLPNGNWTPRDNNGEWDMSCAIDAEWYKGNRPRSG